MCYSQQIYKHIHTLEWGRGFAEWVGGGLKMLCREMKRKMRKKERQTKEKLLLNVCSGEVRMAGWGWRWGWGGGIIRGSREESRLQKLCEITTIRAVVTELSVSTMNMKI